MWKNSYLTWNYFQREFVLPRNQYFHCSKRFCLMNVIKQFVLVTQLVVLSVVIHAQGGGGIKEAELDFIDLCLRDCFRAGPERVLDQAQVRIVHPFLESIGAITLEEFLLRPAIAGGFGAVIALDQPLR